MPLLSNCSVSENSLSFIEWNEDVDLVPKKNRWLSQQAPQFEHNLIVHNTNNCEQEYSVNFHTDLKTYAGSIKHNTADYVKESTCEDLTPKNTHHCLFLWFKNPSTLRISSFSNAGSEREDN